MTLMAYQALEAVTPVESEHAINESLAPDSTGVAGAAKTGGPELLNARTP
jgi:hypothetical protein